MTNIEGWVCKTCQRFYGDGDGAERAARWCCAADLKCATDGCEARVPKGGWTACDPCRDRLQRERWLKLPEVAWDGETPLCLHDDDRYFFGPEDLDNYIENHVVDGMKVEDLQLVICEPDAKPRFELCDVLQDYLSEETETDVGDASEIEKTVNDWIEEHIPQMWVAGKTRPTLDSVKPEVAD
jgi:hypothetical protein